MSEATFSLGITYVLRASLEPFLNHHARTLLNKAQSFCSRVYPQPFTKNLRLMEKLLSNQLAESPKQQTLSTVQPEDDLEEWEHTSDDHNHKTRAKQEYHIGTLRCSTFSEFNF